MWYCYRYKKLNKIGPLHRWKVKLLFKEPWFSYTQVKRYTRSFIWFNVIVISNAIENTQKAFVFDQNFFENGVKRQTNLLSWLGSYLSWEESCSLFAFKLVPRIGLRHHNVNRNNRLIIPRRFFKKINYNKPWTYHQQISPSSFPFNYKYRLKYETSNR